MLWLFPLRHRVAGLEAVAQAVHVRRARLRVHHVRARHKHARARHVRARLKHAQARLSSAQVRLKHAQVHHSSAQVLHSKTAVQVAHIRHILVARLRFSAAHHRQPLAVIAEQGKARQETIAHTPTQAPTQAVAISQVVVTQVVATQAAATQAVVTTAAATQAAVTTAAATQAEVTTVVATATLIPADMVVPDMVVPDMAAMQDPTDLVDMVALDTADTSTTVLPQVMVHTTAASTMVVHALTTIAIAITRASDHADRAIAGTTTIATTAGAGEHPLLHPFVPGVHA